MAVKPFPFFSGALYARKTCFVYLPEGYEDSDRRYPTVYLLHGLYGSESNWTERGGVEQTLDRMISESELRECVVVMPNDGGHAHGTFYADWYDGSGNFEQYMIHDLVPCIDSAFRTIPDKSMRAIGGLSMGGYGAMMLALKNPDVFGAAGSLSGALADMENMSRQEFDRTNYAQILGPLNGPYAKQYDLYILAATRVKEEARPELYFDCGTEDYLYHLNAEFDRYLTNIGYPHEYAEYPGAHTWEYWTEHVKDVLRFFEAYFGRANKVY
ncbi:alpha/beta hydrolase [Paenibacillus thermotolerans]|uniref:alpha/beta hydrolase n=1 Tax=Paenibacillus thermotolerans TaxID=3027807 RepID=UPI0023686229|nr:MULTISPECIES: alpha/beta hydrolase family protein [unclassified Paenibacillus]